MSPPHSCLYLTPKYLYNWKQNFTFDQQLSKHKYQVSHPILCGHKWIANDHCVGTLLFRGCLCKGFATIPPRTIAFSLKNGQMGWFLWTNASESELIIRICPRRQLLQGSHVIAFTAN